MSHSVTLFNELSLTNKFLVLVNYSNKTNTKVRIRKSDILIKSGDNSGYKLNSEKNLIFIDNHLNFSNIKENKKLLSQFLNEVKQFELKSKIKVEEFQKSNVTNYSRLVTTKKSLLRV